MTAGLEVLVNRLRGTDDDRPLKHKGDKIGADGLTCPLDGGTSLGIDYKPHRDDPSVWVGVAYCRSGGHSEIDDIAAAVGLSSAEIREGNEALRYKYRPPGARRRPPDRTDEWTAALWADSDRLDRLRAFGISDDVLRDVNAGWDGERYTFPVYEPFGEVGDILINVRRYRPEPPEDEPKWLSWAGSGAQLYPDVPDGKVVLTEGEKDCLVARSLGLPAVTNTGGALCWRDEWSTLLTGRLVFIVYDRDRAGVAGSKKVARSLRAVGCSVVVVRLPLPFRPTHGADVADFVSDGGDLRALLNDTYLAAKRREPRPKPRLSLPVAPGQPHSVTKGHA